jgi:hypothetical protein
MLTGCERQDGLWEQVRLHVWWACVTYSLVGRGFIVSCTAYIFAWSLAQSSWTANASTVLMYGVRCFAVLCCAVVCSEGSSGQGGCSGRHLFGWRDAMDIVVK